MSDGTLTAIGRESQAFLLAVQALTRVPVQVAWAPDGLRRAARTMPLVGLGVGMVGACVYWAAGLGLPAVVAVLLSTAATLLLTGALHEDGLADCCDGLFGGRTREAALRIMRDSRVGAFGVLGLLVVAGTKLGCLAALPDAGVAMIVAHGASRFWAVVPGVILPYAREDGMAGGMAGPEWPVLAVAGVIGLVPLAMLGWRGLVALLVSGVLAFGVIGWARRRLGGFTGDVLGAVQQVSEAGVYLAAAWGVAY